MAPSHSPTCGKAGGEKGLTVTLRLDGTTLDLVEYRQQQLAPTGGVAGTLVESYDPPTLTKGFPKP
ncbi:MULTISPECIES: hypothetical protein [unclassified Luteococcus]|uniref:hypothetical protein n=1 Tax=unclassified Luteococcus TaxID=2639923 RepID=UPI00313D8A2A